MATKSRKEEGPGWFPDQVMDFSGRKCLNGTGPVPARIVFVDRMPTEREVWSKRPYTSRQAQFFLSKLKEVGFDNRIARFTYAMKHCSRKVNAVEQHWSERMFREELAAVGPEVVVCFGAEPLKAVVGNKYNWEDVHGAFFTPDSIPDCKFQVFATFNLEQVLYGPKWDRHFLRDLDCIRRRMDGTEIPVPKCDCKVVHTPQELDSFNKWLTNKPGRTLVSLDCEWHGKNWMDPNRYFRTVQMGYAKGKVVTLEVAKEGGERCFPCEGALFDSLKGILENPKVDIVGHNVIADGEWLLSYGIDIRPRVVYDTMLAEHIIDQNGPFGLETLAMKYTPYGRYSLDVEVWVRRHKSEKLAESTANGYGYVPWDMLRAYGGADVDVLYYIMEKQIPVLKERGCFKPRGVHGEYPSLFETVMGTQRVTYDLELNGLPVDLAQLDMLTEKYQAAKSKELSKVMAMARAAGFDDFNPRSSDDLRKMLFGKLGLTPVKTTDGDDWGDNVGEMGMDDESEVYASTDKTTLQILEGKHPFVDALLDFRRVDQACKTWLTKEKDGKPAGLYANLWPDNVLRPHFSMLTSTGRMRVSAPNCFPGEVEVLTELGWIRWDRLYERPDRYAIRLAQWDAGSLEITFAVPNCYVMHENAECIHIHSRQQIDIVCTPDHRFTVYDRKNLALSKKLVASDLAHYADFVIPQAGKLVKGGERLTEAQVTVICALQADGYLVPEGGIDWRFTKQRKWYRLMDALKASGVAFRPYLMETAERDRRGVYVGKHDVPEWLKGRKKFGPWLFEYDSDTLSLFEKELWLWDGCASRKSMFASSIPENAGFVQALCLFNGRRGKIRRYVSNTGSTSWQVDAANHGYTQLANLSAEDSGRHTVYCVNMPKDTVIVRYNGKVAFTNQSQNFPKQAEAYLTKIFGAGNEPPMIRTIVRPRHDGWCQIEGDFCAAELNILGNLSQDPNMLRALNTPGLDLHDKTAVDSFGLHMFDENGHEVVEDDLIRLAAEMGEESDDYQHFMKALTYVDQQGKRMTRAEMKGSIRVIAKTLNFGIAYGRGAHAIALAIKATTGSKEPLDSLVPVVAASIDGWKTKAYPTAWQWLVRHQQMVYDPGYVENPWGRRKYVYLRKGEHNASLEREAGNFPIQSTCSDSLQIAMGKLKQMQSEVDFPFILQNQIHDALMIEVPKDCIDKGKKVLHDAMSGIDIPIPGTDKSFRLAIDSDVYERWGVKMK